MLRAGLWTASICSGWCPSCVITRVQRNLLAGLVGKAAWDVFVETGAGLRPALDALGKRDAKARGALALCQYFARFVGETTAANCH